MNANRFSDTETDFTTAVNTSSDSTLRTSQTAKTVTSVPAPSELAASQQAMIMWASKLPDSWTHYATMTFRVPQDPMSAVMKLRSFRDGFQQGRSFLRRCLYCVEPHKTGAAHIHALLEVSREPFTGHCQRCAHPADGSCERVKLIRVDQTTGEIKRYASRHGSVCDDPLWKQLNESWYCHFGMARFVAYKPELKFGAIAYVTKYLFKTDLLEWGYWD